MTENARLDVLLEDYRLIRAEAIYRLGSRQAINGVFVPIVGSIVAAAYSADSLTQGLVLALAVPFVCFETIYLWLAETQALRRASKYLHTLSQQVQQEVKYIQSGRTEPPVLTWEQMLRDSIPHTLRKGYYTWHYFYNTLLFWIPALFFGFAGCYLIWQNYCRLGTALFVGETGAAIVALCAFIRKSAQIVKLYNTADSKNPDTV